MTRQTLSVLVMVMACGSLRATPSGAQAPAAFAQLGAEQKAALLRTRFEQWLEDNRESLNDRQVATVRKAIALVSPDIFRSSPDAGTKARQDAISSELYCSLGSDLAYSFARGTPPSKVKKTWKQAGQDWYEWVTDCVMK